MRYETFDENKFYLVSNFGISNQKIFLDDPDYVRFIFLITHFQSPIQIYNLNWSVEAFLKKTSMRTKPERISAVLKERNVELIAFCIQENRFNILIKNMEEAILSVYMHRVSTAYGKYFNSKYSKKGHVFNGPFKTTLLKDKGEVAETSVYLHKVCLAQNGKQNEAYEKYKWSSYIDYVSESRWGKLLQTELILDQFKNTEAYAKYVAISEAKEPLF